MMEKINTTNALLSAVQGMRTQETRVAKAANDINQTMVEAQNQLALAATNTDKSLPALPTANDSLATATPVSGDIITPIVTMLEAKTAYAANAKVVETVSDMERTTIDKLGRIKDIDV